VSAAKLTASEISRQQMEEVLAAEVKRQVP
jgi:hypothetical protein